MTSISTRIGFLAFALCAALAARHARAADEPTIKLYKAQCSTCHGLDGRGQTTTGKPLGVKDWTDGKTLKATSDDKIKELIRNGAKGKDGKQTMTPFKKLTDQQVAALITYAREIGGGKRK
jgi:mono/diheme cytochrome c family protein